MAIWRHGSIRLSIDGTSANQLSHTRVLKFGSLSKYKVEMKHTDILRVQPKLWIRVDNEG